MKKYLCKIKVMVLTLMLVCNLPLMQANAAETENVYNFYYYRLDSVQQSIYDQIAFEVYEDDSANAYAIVVTDLDNISSEEIEEAVEAYYNDSFLYYFYDMSELTIYSLEEYYENHLIVKVPLVDANEELFVSYLDYAEALALYYKADQYTAMKALAMTTVQLAEAQVVDVSKAVRMLENALETMGFPTVTVYKDDTYESLLTYTFFDGEWYAIDLPEEVYLRETIENNGENEDGGEFQYFLLGADGVETGKFMFEYPELAEERYRRVVYEVEYSLERRSVQDGETEEMVPLYHMYSFGNDSPSPVWNVADAKGQMIGFDTVKEYYVPLEDYDYSGGWEVTDYGAFEYVEYTGNLLMRTYNTWYQQSYTEGIKMYYHQDNQASMGFKYTRVVEE